PVPAHKARADVVQIGIGTEHNPDSGKWNQLLRVGDITSGENVEVGEERRRPDKCLPQLVTPFQVILQGQLQVILSLGSDRNLAGRVGIVLLSLAAGKHRHGLEKVGILYSVQYRVGRPQLLGLLPIIVKPEVFSGFCVVFAVTSEYGGEKLENIQWQAADVDLLEDGSDCRLLGFLVQLDRRDLVFLCRLNNLTIEIHSQLCVGRAHDPFY